MRYFYTLILLFFGTTLFSQSSYPEGFNEEVAFDIFDAPAGMLHTDSNYAFVWELSGKVWLIKDQVVHPAPILDLSEEVGFWGDHGMIGAALDPDFFENGFIYLLYNVDRHHLLNFGTDQYDPTLSESGTASIGRLTRYKLNTVDFQFVIPDSRLVLIGSEINNGIPTSAASHGVGSIVFGKDGSLLVSCGDSNTWVGKNEFEGYNGEGPVPLYGYDDVGLADGSMSEGEFVGAFRAQYMDGLNGKLIRIDSETGLGIPNNPYFSAEAPNNARSKIWAMGFRNPYRMTLRPGTGDDNNPGTIFISDVGDWVWEEINVVFDKGLNFGWPMYQGPNQHDFYYNVKTQNTNATNPIGQSTSCPNTFFNYQDLIQQPNAPHEYFYPNPCNEGQVVPSDIFTFQHERPALAYSNSVIEGAYAVTPAYNEQGLASSISVSDPNHGIGAEDFSGISGSGGVFLTGEQIPQEYQDWYIQGDFSGWLRAFKFNEFNELTAVEQWSDYVGAPIHISQDPSDGCIYVTSISPSEIKRICFGGNLKPLAIATPELVYGTSPIQVTFDASESYDPEGGPLDFKWTFSDGGSSTNSIVTHEFIAPTNDVTIFKAKIVVTDELGLSDSLTVPVSLNNTPPEVDIISLEENQLLSLELPTYADFKASVIDLEHSENEIDFDWIIYLHHNTHFHRLDEVQGNNSNYTFHPLGCSENEVFWFRIGLTVTDPGGLTDYDELFMYPDCEGILPSVEFGDELFVLFPNPAVDFIELHSSVSLGNGLTYSIYSAEGKKISENFIPVYNDRRYFQLDISTLSQAGYVLEVTIDGKKHRERFVKITN